MYKLKVVPKATKLLEAKFCFRKSYFLFYVYNSFTFLAHPPKNRGFPKAVFAQGENKTNKKKSHIISLQL